MALSWNTLRALPRLTSYEDAAKYEAEVKPIRGRAPETKPVGKRNQWWNTIKREDNGDIVISTYCGPILRYRENGDLVIYDPAGWRKASQNEMITEITGIPTDTIDGKAWVEVSNGTFYLRSYQHKVWDRDKREYVNNPEPVAENIFRRVEHLQSSAYYESRSWVFMNPPTNAVYYIRRKEMNKVMKRYATFINYAKAVDALRNGELFWPKEIASIFDASADDGGAYYWGNAGMPRRIFHDDKFDHNDAEALCNLMLSDDPADNYKAYAWLKAGDDRSVEESIKRVLIIHHHDEVLERVDMTGVQAKNRYAWVDLT
jgi:hypothetical protein